jgi:CRISPR-associated endonuclease Csn1
VPLNEVIEHQKQQVDQKLTKESKTALPIKLANGNFLFHLSPNDLVYVPEIDELTSDNKIDFGNLDNSQRSRIYKFTDGSGTTAKFYSCKYCKCIIQYE